MKRFFTPRVALSMIGALLLLSTLSLMAAFAGVLHALDIFTVSVIFLIVYVTAGVFFFSER